MANLRDVAFPRMPCAPCGRSMRNEHAVDDYRARRSSRGSGAFDRVECQNYWCQFSSLRNDRAANETDGHTRLWPGNWYRKRGKRFQRNSVTAAAPSASRVVVS